MAEHARSPHLHPETRGARRQLSPVEVGQIRARQRPNSDFGSILRRGAVGTLQTVQSRTAGYLPPGGAVVSAALSGAGALLDAQSQAAMGPSAITGGGIGGGLAGELGGGAGIGAGSMDQREVLAATDRMQKENQMFNLQFVQVQEAFARDSRTYTAISNLLKTKNDTARNTLSNLR